MIGVSDDDAKNVKKNLEMIRGHQKPCLCEESCWPDNPDQDSELFDEVGSFWEKHCRVWAS